MDNNQLTGQVASAAGKPPSLDDKQKALQAAKAEADRLRDEAQAKQEEVKQRQVQVDALVRALESYKKPAADAMKKALEAAMMLIAREAKFAALTVKDQRDAIDKKIVDYDADIAARTSRYENLQTAAARDADAARKAATLALDAEAQYEASKNTPKALEGKMKELVALIDEAAKAKGQGAYPVMYFLIGRAEALAQQLDIPAAEAYEAELVRLRDVADGDRAMAAQTAAAAAASASAVLEEAKKLAAASGTLRSDLLKELKDMPVLASVQ